jgi:Ca2+-binding RTX toxin-like protein
VFAAQERYLSDEDYLITNDGTNTRLGPDQLAPAFVSTRPTSQPASGAELRADRSDRSKKALFVTGTNGPDVIRFQKVGNNLKVLINGQSAGSFSRFTRVIAYGLGGNDDIRMDAQGSYSTVFFGGEGDDTLVAGNGPSILVGGKGDDTLTGGNVADLLVGGEGADILYGGNGDDLLVGGRTSYDAGTNDGDIPALTRARNASAATVFIPGTTATDDGSADELFGGKGKDWFLFKNGNGVTDVAKGEKVVSL